MNKQRELSFKSIKEYRKFCDMLSYEQLSQLDIYEKAEDKYNEYLKNMGGSP